MYLSLAKVTESEYDLIYHKIELVEQELASYDYYNSETQFEQIVANMNLTDSILNMEMKKYQVGKNLVSLLLNYYILNMTDYC